jgi:hypothetical protein
MGWEAVSCWIEGHPGLASWIQAIFSVFAIAAAGYFPVAHERKRENRARKNMLRTLGYVAYTLETLIDGLSKALADKDLQRSWGQSANDRKIRIVGQALSEIPASLLVGVELHLLADLRFAQECAVEADDFIRAVSPDDISVIFENVRLIETCQRCIVDVQIAQEAVEALAKNYK